MKERKKETGRKPCIAETNWERDNRQYIFRKVGKEKKWEERKVERNKKEERWNKIKWDEKFSLI